MQFDDRLATVLRNRADGELAARTQFRQLLDLLGTAQDSADSELRNAAYARLSELAETLPQEEQARILREPGIRLRRPRLVRLLAAGDAKTAASAMATARLTDEQWLALIPDLPVTARGFLRHRRDLSDDVKALLKRLGVHDLALPEPVQAAAERARGDRADGSPAAGIGALRQRIEAFTETRRSQPRAPRLPLGDREESAPLTAIDFATDPGGTVIWSGGKAAPMMVGMALLPPSGGTLATLAPATIAAALRRGPLNAEEVAIDAAPQISGGWLIEAAPLFHRQTGGFLGYRGRLTRAPEKSDTGESQGDQMRQVLHELRTPVNAIQGFAEIIQQQLFGTAPHEYRAHAAAISVDSAKLLAGFDEVDRLVKLENAVVALDEGRTDLRATITETTQRLQGVLRPRNAGFALDVSDGDFTVALDRGEALALCWRLLATAAGALAPGEQIALSLRSDGAKVELQMDVPRALAENGRPDTTSNARRRAVSAGIFGPSFSFRLAQAEARAAGGSLTCDDHRVTLVLPALTGSADDPSAETGRASG
ncbi:sensor histidine kinase [Aurantiacibacter aquimixticola]|uniref:histidine kinase n=1 Tax=Aurantiacibacter aquimixticola TaxID=1958945 RepID=A0A419RR89_9SPHN|nr:histidine kinase dimerization/phospho-acceptor domain-containing protein [Aurantiacibacter aquimixticola]RJY08295.1 sensor histidine kinase [Aurantiacibacter aquimixticola]